MSPVDSLEQHRELRCRQRYASILRSRPDEPAALQALCHKAQARSIPPQYFEQIAAPAAKDEDMTAERAAGQRVLYQSAQTREPFAHVGRSRSQPHTRAHRHSARDDAHRCNSATRAHTNAASSALVSIRTVAPEASTSCTMPLRPTAASERVAG